MELCDRCAAFRHPNRDPQCQRKEQINLGNSDPLPGCPIPPHPSRVRVQNQTNGEFSSSTYRLPEYEVIETIAHHLISERSRRVTDLSALTAGRLAIRTQLGLSYKDWHRYLSQARILAKSMGPKSSDYKSPLHLPQKPRYVTPSNINAVLALQEQFLDKSGTISQVTRKSTAYKEAKLSLAKELGLDEDEIKHLTQYARSVRVKNKRS